MKIQVLEVPIDALTVPQALRRIDELVGGRTNASILTPNPEFILQAQHDSDFATTLKHTDLNLPDGIGVAWAATYLAQRDTSPLAAILRGIGLLFTIPFNSQVLKKVIPERITGVDMVVEICNLAASRGYRVYFLGGMPGVAEATAKHLNWLYGNLRVAGFSEGPPGDSESETIEHLRRVKPDIVFLAFPQKEQARWIREILPTLSDCMFMGIGGAFDFIVNAIPKNDPTGRFRQRRAPKVIQSMNLEWLWRLITQPWRLKRIFNATFGFVIKVISWKLAHLKVESPNV